jgi:hypothetical protein
MLCVRDNAGEITLWNIEDDTRLASANDRRFIDVAAGQRGCLARDDANALFVSSAKDAIPIDVPGAVVAIATAEDGFLVVADQIHQLDDRGKVVESWPRGPGVTAVARVGSYLITGFSDGTLELTAVEEEAPEAATSFERVAASRVETITAGPKGTIAVGYANGTMGLWNVLDGSRLTAANLHGRIVHLDVEDGHLYAATDLGDSLTLSLEAFYRDYCDLLQQVWSKTPVVWQQGRALESEVGKHRCNQ